ncbi:hypothetical protein F4556_000156 [Kitasatospora gansuensis]|uniref:Secreted protein n=1 Tax=Kitasatospora gansuensis TaxID=258050 RepID=A0A7W7S823_9ACTN|nr:hypothetical protein [Kitasatospora gansuensis]MBB4944621.1 hypothetical protein [Kitasatospora gansuensis]
MRKLKSLATVVATLGLLLGTTVLGAGSAQAYPGDNICRYQWVNLGSNAGNYNVLPCVYQDSGGKLHAKAQAANGTTDVWLYVELGVSHGGPVEWMSSTINRALVNGSGYVYTLPSDGVPACWGCTYYAMTWVTNKSVRYGDVEAGPIHV